LFRFPPLALWPWPAQENFFDSDNYAGLISGKWVTVRFRVKGMLLIHAGNLLIVFFFFFSQFVFQSVFNLVLTLHLEPHFVFEINKNHSQQRRVPGQDTRAGKGIGKGDGGAPARADHEHRQTHVRDGAHSRARLHLPQSDGQMMQKKKKN
jgi:hypothetical protein